MFPIFFDDAAAPTTGFSAQVAALIESGVADFVVLAEVQPMEPLATWTDALLGGLAHAYYTTWPTQIATSIVPGGIYRRLDYVRQDTIVLTARASAAIVDANPGSYFLDTATNRLYVSTTTGAHPDTFALIGAWFSMFFSSNSISFSDQPLYAPLVLGDLPTLTSEMPDSLFGATLSDSGNLSLLNADGLFDRLSRLYIWRNKLAFFKLGGQSLLYSQFSLINTLRINSIDVDDAVAVIKLESLGSILNKSLPLRTWGDGTINSFGPVPIASGVLGTSQPLVFGRVEACPFVLASSDVIAAGLPGEGTVLSSVWLAYDFNSGPYGFCQITDVIAINRSTKFPTPLQVGLDYVVAGAAVTVLNLSYMDDTHDLIGTLTNISFLAAPQFGAMAKAILELCGESTANIDDAAFAAANAAAPQILARYVASPIIAADLMRELEQSVNGQVYQGPDGRWTCRVLVPDIPASVVELSDVDFVSWEPEDDENLESVLTEMRIRWGHQPLADAWYEASSSSDTTRYGSETNDTHRIDTWLTVADDATALANHLRFLRSVPMMLTRAEQRGLGLMRSNAGDLVSVTRDRAPQARTGRYDTHLLRIVKITKALGPDVPTVSVTLSDLDGQTDRVFRLVGSGSTMAWSTATASEKARYGFLGDTSRYIDPTDPVTRDCKALW